MATTLTPYLSFDGNTREAFAFYEKALGAKIETMMSYDDMPAMPAGDAGCGDGPPPSGTASCMRAWRCPAGRCSSPAIPLPACLTRASRA